MDHDHDDRSVELIHPSYFVIDDDEMEMISPFESEAAAPAAAATTLSQEAALAAASTTPSQDATTAVATSCPATTNHPETPDVFSHPTSPDAKPTITCSALLELARSTGSVNRYDWELIPEEGAAPFKSAPPSANLYDDDDDSFQIIDKYEIAISAWEAANPSAGSYTAALTKAMHDYHVENPVPAWAIEIPSNEELWIEETAGTHQRLYLEFRHVHQSTLALFAQFGPGTAYWDVEEQEWVMGEDPEGFEAYYTDSDDSDAEDDSDDEDEPDDDRTVCYEGTASNDCEDYDSDDFEDGDDNDSDDEAEDTAYPTYHSQERGYFFNYRCTFMEREFFDDESQRVWDAWGRTEEMGDAIWARRMRMESWVDRGFDVGQFQDPVPCPCNFCVGQEWLLRAARREEEERKEKWIHAELDGDLLVSWEQPRVSLSTLGFTFRDLRYCLLDRPLVPEDMWKFDHHYPYDMSIFAQAHYPGTVGRDEGILINLD